MKLPFQRTLGGLLVAGGLVGYLEWGRPRRTVIQEPDPYMGWRMIESQVHHDRFLKIEERINSYGFRGNEWNITKTAGTVRIAAQGSSMTYGSSVPFESLYTTQLEQFLTNGGVRSEVFNCAVQGYTLEQCVRNYETRVSNFKPDYLIQAFADQDVHPMDTPPVVPRGDLRPWITRSEFFRKYQYEWQDRFRKWFPESPVPGWVGPSKKNIQNQLLQQNPFAPELMPLWEEAERKMTRLHDLVVGDGGKLVITVLPQPPQTMNPLFQGPEVVWKRFAAARPETCIYVDSIEALRAAVAPIRQRITELKDPGEIYKWTANLGNVAPDHVYHGDVGGHFNEKGMHVIAEALAKGLLPAVKPK